MSHLPIYIGCAGWSVGREHAAAFPAEGTHLQRYGSQFNCVEINSSFYRPHRHQTYARWATSVPKEFRFSVKIPKRITHELRLADCEQPLEEFLDQCSGLGERLGCLLVQLPPSLAFEEVIAQGFFRVLKEQYSGTVILEPRHESWVDAAPLLRAYRITQAVIDPSRISTDSSTAGSPKVQYWRLHGSPRIYYSAYDLAYLKNLANQLRVAAGEGATVWCILDNTASGAALRNALELSTLLTMSINESSGPPGFSCIHEGS
ncbi:hypothetical protein ASC74_03435 [Pseudomonas sp. Root329]|uniref:DUF72 domain-containing protein n=1 Tax=Pseudomonas sp. Root329 TaxID=1736515 RepID=UPI0006FBE5B9|nr:DUF72 domain-containing protein [Pseudomonas sp. Root329]KQV17956.1 hypothetical protein ASC74_03435 [Pseudomonas sp. Root329]